MIFMTLTEAAKRLKPAGKVPRAILVTDSERLPAPSARLLDSLPKGAAVLVRHRHPRSRAALAARLAGPCRARGLRLMVAGDWRLAAEIGATGLHVPEQEGLTGLLAPALGWARRRGILVTMACHSRQALSRARTIGVDAAFLSPAFSTDSHPGARFLGPLRWRLLARSAGLPCIALGGIDSVTVRKLNACPVAGYGAIQGWLRVSACGRP
jgi:thiamine-phosphate pyrophosphorylase